MKNFVRSLSFQSACRIVVFLVLISPIFPHTEAFAQVSTEPQTPNFEVLSGRIKPGDQITVIGTDGVRLKGPLLDLTPKSVAIGLGSQRQRVAFPVTDVVRVERNKSHVKMGAWIGLISGIGLGVVQNYLCTGESNGGCPGVIVAMAGFGALEGAGVGKGIDMVFGHRVIFENANSLSGLPARVSLPKEHGPEIFGSIGAGRTPDFATPHASASAGFGMRFAIGLSAEVEVSHTLKGTLHTESCPHVSAECFPAYIGRSGTAGLESMGIATARIRYSYSRWHVQPFVTAGYAILSTKRQVAIPNQQTFKQTSGSVPLGLGVRIPVTRSIAIRPEATYYNGDAELTRAVIGVVYQRKGGR